MTGSGPAGGAGPARAERRSALFIGHGGPRNAIVDNPVSRAWTELGRALRPLRREGVLVLGSGKIVHNLALRDWEDAAGARPAPWARGFDAWVADRVRAGDHAALAGSEAHLLRPLAAPAREHFLPLLPILGLREEGEAVACLCERIVMGSLSMRSLLVG